MCCAVSAVADTPVITAVRLGEHTGAVQNVSGKKRALRGETVDVGSSCNVIAVTAEARRTVLQRDPQKVGAFHIKVNSGDGLRTKFTNAGRTKPTFADGLVRENEAAAGGPRKIMRRLNEKHGQKRKYPHFDFR